MTSTLAVILRPGPISPTKAVAAELGFCPGHEGAKFLDYGAAVRHNRLGDHGPGSEPGPAFHVDHAVGCPWGGHRCLFPVESLHRWHRAVLAWHPAAQRQSRPAV